MALKIVLLALLVCCTASEVQSQGDDTSLPLSYDVTELQGDGATCPSNRLRQRTRNSITANIHTQLQNVVTPQMRVETPYCPCASGGRRIAYLNMTDPNQQCPPNWQEFSTSSLRLCSRRSTSTLSSSCDSVSFPNYGGNSYSQVCGRVTGYHYCSTDAFGHLVENDIETFYIDGVSITHGRSPRQHVWTFAAGLDERDTVYGCPCIADPNSANVFIPTFVGNDYFCDTGYTETLYPQCGHISTDLEISHPLWDGGGCGPTGGCCESNNPPWFCKTLPQPTTDDIEVRICGDEELSNEDILVELIEIYVN